MAQNGLFKRLIEGTEKDDEYARSSLPTNRFSLFWDVFKSNFFKLVGVNLILLLFFLPLFASLLVKNNSLLLNAQEVPFSSNLVVGYPIVPLPAGQEEALVLFTNRSFYLTLPLVMLIAAVGLSGGLYVIRNLVWTEGVLVVSDFWRGIRMNFISVMQTCIFFSLVMLGTLFGADYLTYLMAIGWGTRWVLVICKIMCYLLLAFCALVSAHMLTMGVTYNLSFFKLLHNAFVFSYALVIPNVVFLALAALPFLLMFLLPLSTIYMFALMLIIIIGISYALLVWTDYAQWAFDKFINPRIEGAKVDRGIYKKDKKKGEDESDSAAFQQYRIQKKETLKLLAEDHLVSNPIKPIDDDIAVEELPEHYTRKDLERLAEQKQKMIDDANAWAEEHKDDEKYKQFAEIKAAKAAEDEVRRAKLESYKKAEKNRRNKDKK